MFHRYICVLIDNERKVVHFGMVWHIDTENGTKPFKLNFFPIETK